MRTSVESRCPCFETRAFRALLGMRAVVNAMRHTPILRSGPKARVSKDATNDLQAYSHILEHTLTASRHPGRRAQRADPGRLGRNDS
jgi:hypothetical protein